MDNFFLVERNMCLVSVIFVKNKKKILHGVPSGN
jgi:hypothetical protein